MSQSPLSEETNFFRRLGFFWMGLLQCRQFDYFFYRTRRRTNKIIGQIGWVFDNENREHKQLASISLSLSLAGRHPHRDGDLPDGDLRMRGGRRGHRRLLLRLPLPALRRLLRLGRVEEPHRRGIRDR